MKSHSSKKWIILFTSILYTILGSNLYSQPNNHNFPDHPLVISYTPTQYQAAQQNWAVTETKEGFMIFGNTDGFLMYFGHDWLLHRTNRSPSYLFTSNDGIVYAGVSGDLGKISYDQPANFKFESLLDNTEFSSIEFLDTYQIVELDSRIFFITDGGIFMLFEDEINYWQNVLPVVLPINDLIWLQTYDGILFNIFDEPDQSIFEAPLIYYAFKNPDGSLSAFSHYGDTFVLSYRDNNIEVTESVDQRFTVFTDFEILRMNKNTSGIYALNTMMNGIIILDELGYKLAHYNDTNGLPDNALNSAYLDTHNNLWLAGNYGIHQVVTGTNTSILSTNLGIRGIIWGFDSYNNNYFVSTSEGLYYQSINKESFDSFTKISSDYNLTYGDFYQLIDPETGLKKLFYLSMDGVFKISEDNSVTQITDLVFLWFLQPQNLQNLIIGVDIYGQINILRFLEGNWVIETSYDYYFPDYISSINSINDNGALITFYDSGIVFLEVIPKNSEVEPRVDTIKTITDFIDFDLHIRSVEIPSDTINLKNVTTTDFNGETLVFAKNSILKLDYRKLPDIIRLEPWGLIGIDQDKWHYSTLIRTTEGNIWFIRSTINSAQVGALNISDLDLRINFPFAFFNTWEVNSIHYDAENDRVFAINPLKILSRNSNDIYADVVTKPDIQLISFTGKNQDFISLSSLSSTNKIFLDFKNRNLTIEISSTNLVNPLGMRYSFYLEGYDTRFSQWGDNTEKHYTNLSQGSYTFHARSLSPDGSITEKQLLSFHISPPWYLTWGAYAAYLSLLICFIYGLIWYRSQKLIKTNKKLETLIERRLSNLTSIMNDLLHQKNELRRQYEHKSQMSKISTHDIKNPLTAIKGYAYLIGAENDLDEIKKNASVIDELVTKANVILDTIAKNEQLTGIELEIKKVDLPLLIKTIINQYAIFLEEKMQKIELYYAEIPPIDADAVRLTEIFENLITNAIKYSPHNSIISIHIACNVVEDIVELWVIDQGPGFTKDDKIKAFNEYQTLSAKPTGNEESTGLGLFITRKLIEAHNGSISIEDNPDGKGAKIVVSIPVAYKTD